MAFPSIAELRQQELELVFPRFTIADAWELGSILVALGRERGLPIAIDIMHGQQQVFHAALEGSSAHNDSWLRRKVATVLEHGSSSLLVGQLAKAGSAGSFEAQPWIDVQRFSGHGGGFPIRVLNVGLVGCVAVSGLPQEDDHALVVEGIRGFLARA